MNKYKVCMANRKLDLVRELEIVAGSCLEAISKAAAQMKGTGYFEVESVLLVCVLG